MFHIKFNKFICLSEWMLMYCQCVWLARMNGTFHRVSGACVRVWWHCQFEPVWTSLSRRQVRTLSTSSIRSLRECRKLVDASPVLFGRGRLQPAVVSYKVEQYQVCCLPSGRRRRKEEFPYFGDQPDLASNYREFSNACWFVSFYYFMFTEFAAPDSIFV